MDGGKTRDVSCDDFSCLNETIFFLNGIKNWGDWLAYLKKKRSNFYKKMKSSFDGDLVTKIKFEADNSCLNCFGKDLACRRSDSKQHQTVNDSIRRNFSCINCELYNRWIYLDESVSNVDENGDVKSYSTGSVGKLLNSELHYESYENISMKVKLSPNKFGSSKVFYINPFFIKTFFNWTIEQNGGALSNHFPKLIDSFICSNTGFIIESKGKSKWFLNRMNPDRYSGVHSPGSPRKSSSKSINTSKTDIVTDTSKLAFGLFKQISSVIFFFMNNGMFLGEINSDQLLYYESKCIYKHDWLLVDSPITLFINPGKKSSFKINRKTRLATDQLNRRKNKGRIKVLKEYVITVDCDLSKQIKSLQDKSCYETVRRVSITDNYERDTLLDNNSKYVYLLEYYLMILHLMTNKYIFEEVNKDPKLKSFWRKHWKDEDSMNDVNSKLTKFHNKTIIKERDIIKFLYNKEMNLQSPFLIKDYIKITNRK